MSVQCNSIQFDAIRGDPLGVGFWREHKWVDAFRGARGCVRCLEQAILKYIHSIQEVKKTRFHCERPANTGSGRSQLVARQVCTRRPHWRALHDTLTFANEYAAK
jgi:hypothetical protein